MSPNDLRKLQAEIRQLPYTSTETGCFLDKLAEIVAEMNRDVERVEQIRALESGGEFPIGFRWKLKEILK